MIVTWDWSYQLEDRDIKTIGPGDIWRWRVQSMVTGQMIPDSPFGVCDIIGELNHRVNVVGFNKANNAVVQYSNEQLSLRLSDGLCKISGKVLDYSGMGRRLPILFETTNQQYSIATNTVGEWYQFFVPKTKVSIIIDDVKVWLEIPPTNELNYSDIEGQFGYRIPK
jgi:hypothetical protein